MPPPLPRAFLSHSSADKPFVTEVFKELGQTLAELDQETFEPAKFTSDAILAAMNRCGAFVLFASSNSMKSRWVADEIKIALDRTKNKQINRIIVYCADKAVFGLLNPELKAYNIVRIEKSPLVCARQIRGVLAEISAATTRSDLFISRDENIAELKKLMIDPDKNYRTLAVSGFERLGRRTLVNRFCRDVYGSFEPPRKAIHVDLTTSPDDLYRQLLLLQFETLDRAELILKISHFSSVAPAQQVALLGAEIEIIYNQREFIQFVDQGGLIADDGDLSELVQSLLRHNKAITDLIHVLILYRTPPPKVQKKYDDIAFYRLPPLSDSQAEISLLHELKKRKATLNKEQVVKLVSACDGHPANLDYLIGYIFDGSMINRLRLDEVLSGSKDFMNYKRERAAAYVTKFPFNPIESLIIAALVNYRALAAEMLAEIAALRGGDPAATGLALGRLYELNIIDTDGSHYRLIRPLRDALERDPRFDLTKNESDQVAQMLVSVIESYGEGDSVPANLMEAASIAAIKNGSNASGWARHLVLPSHYIWLARTAYHSRNYRDALEFSRKALELSFNITDEAKLEALRFSGLACARLGLENDLDSIVKSIQRIRNKRSAGTVNFLLGFSSRLRGNLNAALAELEAAATKLKGSLDVQRELISVHLAKTNFQEALRLSEDLVRRSEDNPYALDGYLQAKIATADNIDSLEHDADFVRRFAKLEEVGDGPGKAFFSLRKTDLAIKKKDKEGAVRFAYQAVKNAPNLPAAHAAYAKALIADGQLESAWAAVKAVEEIGTRKHRTKDGLENLILYQIRFEYNLSKGSYDLCQQDVLNMNALDSDHASSMKRELIHAVAKSGAKVGVSLAQWLKS